MTALIYNGSPMALITAFDPWKSPLCSCRKKFSLSPYAGCNHGCRYCYASTYIRSFNKPRPKNDFIKTLKREIKKIPAGSAITIANSSDPYCALELKHELTRMAISVLSGHGIRLFLVTKSALILRDLDVLKDTPQVVVCISITILDERLARKLEPG